MSTLESLGFKKLSDTHYIYNREPLRISIDTDGIEISYIWFNDTLLLAFYTLSADENIIDVMKRFKYLQYAIPDLKLCGNQKSIGV